MAFLCLYCFGDYKVWIQRDFFLKEFHFFLPFPFLQTILSLQVI